MVPDATAPDAMPCNVSRSPAPVKTGSAFARIYAVQGETDAIRSARRHRPITQTSAAAAGDADAPLVFDAPDGSSMIGAEHAP
jgi:hypothetical protein